MSEPFTEAGPETPWVEPRVGYTFKPAPVVVSLQYQEEKLQACGLDPALFDNTVDPSFYIGLGIQAGIRNGITAEGNINMMTRLIQYRPVRPGEELTARGCITDIRDVPRGQVVSTDAWFEDDKGTRVIAVPRQSLRPGKNQPGQGRPDKAGKQVTAAGAGAGDRPPPIIDNPADLTRLSQHRLSPTRVKDYSSEGNAIHYEMDAAKRAGFRAPIIGGGMGVHYLLAGLFQVFAPSSLNLDIFFRRPIFWDDEFLVAAMPDKPLHDTASHETNGKTRWTAMALLRQGDIAVGQSGTGNTGQGSNSLKVLTEARINGMSRTS